MHTVETTRELIPIGIQEFLAMMVDSGSRGAFPLTMKAKTIPDYRKTGCPFRNNLFKIAVVNGFLNWDYTAAVNRQRVREGETPNFEAMPRAWGTQLTKTPLISHINKEGKHRLYLKFKVQKVLDTYFVDNNNTSLLKSDVEPWLNKPRPNTRQGVDGEVFERDYAVDNIMEISYRGLRYKLHVEE